MRNSARAEGQLTKSIPATIERHERQVSRVVIALFIALAVGFSLGPIFEGPDEFEHYRFIRVLIQKRSLPNPYHEQGAQFHQAPLYYALVAPVTFLVNDDNFSQVDGQLNPFRGYEFTIPGNDNKNVFLHPRAERFPYQDSSVARTVHMLRLVSVALGTGTIVASYAVFRILWPTRTDRLLMALGFVAFMPHFLYMSSVITNDNLLFLLATISLLLLLRQLKDGPSWHNAVLLGLILGAALLTKVNAAFLVFPVGLAILLDRRTWRYASLTLAVTVSIAGWWYARNLILYDDITSARALFEAAQPNEAIQMGALVPGVGLSNLPFTYRSFWARFGDGRVPVGQPIYVFFDFLTAAVLVGFAVWITRWIVTLKARLNDNVKVQQFLVVGMFILAWMAFLGYYSSIAINGHQGRYLLPGIAGWGALVTLGLETWTPDQIRVPAALGGLTVYFFVATVTLFGYFLPSYALLRAPDTIEDSLGLRFGNAAELISIEPVISRARPGDVIRISLFWRAIRPTDTSLQTYLHSSDSELVRRDSLPGTGNLLSTDWRPGEIWAEEYVIRIPADAETQVTYPLVAGLYDPDSEQPLIAVNQDGEVVTPYVGTIAINGPPQPFQPAYRFGDHIGLAEPTISLSMGELEVCLLWVSLAPISVDYHIFVHALGSDGELVSQVDFQPNSGRYPTSVWNPGETISECIALDASELPADDWYVGIGLYELTSGQRLPVEDLQGQAIGDNMVRVRP